MPGGVAGVQEKSTICPGKAEGSGVRVNSVVALTVKDALATTEVEPTGVIVTLYVPGGTAGTAKLRLLGVPDATNDVPK
jgi:hypothetical protein